MKDLTIGLWMGDLAAALRHIGSSGKDYVALKVTEYYTKCSLEDGGEPMNFNVLELSQANKTGGVKTQIKGIVYGVKANEKGRMIPDKEADVSGEEVVFSFKELDEIASILASDNTSVRFDVTRENNNCMASFATHGKEKAMMMLPLKKATDIQSMPVLGSTKFASVKLKMGFVKHLAAESKAVLVKSNKNSVDAVVFNFSNKNPRYLMTDGVAAAFGELPEDSFEGVGCEGYFGTSTELIKNISHSDAKSAVTIEYYGESETPTLFVLSCESNGLVTSYISPIIIPGYGAAGAYDLLLTLLGESGASMEISRTELSKAVKLLSVGSDDGVSLTFGLSEKGISVIGPNGSKYPVKGKVECVENGSNSMRFNPKRFCSISDSLMLKTDENSKEEEPARVVLTSKAFIFKDCPEGSNLLLMKVLDKSASKSAKKEKAKAEKAKEEEKPAENSEG